MADIFDTLDEAPAQAGGDIFDEISPPVIRRAAPGITAPQDMRAAVRKVGGELAVGEKGDTHPDIIQRDKIPATDVDQRGFVGPNGEFYDRETAKVAAGLGSDLEEGRAHSTDLNKAQAVTPPGQLPPGWKPRLTAEQMLVDPVTGLKRESGMEPGTELTTAIALAPLDIQARLEKIMAPEPEVQEYTVPKETEAQRAAAVSPPGKAPMITTLGGRPQPMGTYAEQPEERQRQFFEGLQTPGISLDLFKAHVEPDDPAWAAAIKEAENILVSLPEFMTTPLGILTAGIGAEGKAAGMAIRYAFAADMLYGMFSAVPNLRDNWKYMTPTEKGQAVGQFLGSAAMVGLLTRPEIRGTVKDPLVNLAHREGQLAPDIIRLRPGGEPIFGAEPKPLPSPLLTAAGAPALLPPPAQRPGAEEPLREAPVAEPTREAPAPSTARLAPPAERPELIGTGGELLRQRLGAEPGVLPPEVPERAPLPAPKPAPKPIAKGRFADFEAALSEPGLKRAKPMKYEAGMAVRSFEDLESLANLAKKEPKDMEGVVRNQLVREAAEVALGFGSQEEATAVKKLGERPMDWRVKPEAAEWIVKNAERMGWQGNVALPEVQDWVSRHAEPTKHWDYSPEDLQRYQEMTAHLAAFPDERVNGPEWKAVSRNIEILKNKYNGNPPLQLVKKPTAAAPVPPKPAEVPPKPGDLMTVPEAPPESAPLEEHRKAMAAIQAHGDAVEARISQIDNQLASISVEQGKRPITDAKYNKLQKQADDLRSERYDLTEKIRPRVKSMLGTVEGNIGLARFRLEYQPYVGPGAIPVPAEGGKVTGKVLRAQKENLLQQIEDAIKTAPDDGSKITLSVPGDGDFTIRNDKETLKRFRDLVSDRFPETVGGLKEPKLPSGRGKNPPKVTEPTGQDLPKVIGNTVSDDPGRFTIQYAYADGTQIVATDGRQLVRIVTDKAPGTITQPVRINSDGKVLSPDSKEGAEAVSGKFPNYNMVRPANPTLVIGGTDTGALFHIVRQAEVFRDTSETDRTKRNAYPVKLYVNPDGSMGARMEVKGDLFEHNIKANAQHIGDYNADYVMNAVEVARRLGNEKIDIYVDGTDGPIVFRGKNHEHLLMAMRGEKGPIRDTPRTIGRPLHPALPETLGPLEHPEGSRTFYRDVKGVGRFSATLENRKITLSQERALGYTDKAGRPAMEYSPVGKTIDLKKWAAADLAGRETLVRRELESVNKEQRIPKESMGKAVSALVEAVNEAEKERQSIIDEGQARAAGKTAPEPAPAPAPTPTPTPEAPPATAPQPSPAAPTQPAPGPPPEAAPPTGPSIITKAGADAIRERIKKNIREHKPEAPKPLESLEDLEDVGEYAPLEAKKTLAERKLGEKIFSDAVQLGTYYIQNGLHKFEPWAAQMRSDFGEAIEPYLKSIYETARVTIESPSGEAGGTGRPPGLQPGLDPPERRIVTARSEHTKPVDESRLPKEVLPHLDPHQKQGAALGINSLEERGGALIGDGTGTGKTREGLTVAKYWADKGFKVIYITKAEAIKPDWKKGTFGGSLWNDSQAMGIKVKLARHGSVARGEIGITTYENAASVNKFADPYTVLIWDESHALKNKSARGLAGDKANSKAHAVLFMTATPADKPEHIYYLTRMGIMEGKSPAEQMKALGMAKVTMGIWETDPATGQRRKVNRTFWAPDPNISEEERNNRFRALFDRMTAKGAMIKREISMKGVHVQVLQVALPPDAHATLQEILRFFEADTIEDLKGIKKAIVLQHLRRQQEPFKIAPTLLLSQRELAAGRQVVIFVSRVNESEVGKWVQGPDGERIREVMMSSEGTAKALRDAFHEAGIHDIAEIHGGADQASLEAMADFNSGKKRVCIATIESGGTGINLDDIVGNRPRSMIVVTAPFDAVGNVQAAGRIWRLKTLSGANIFYLFGDTEVDAWNADIIGSKMAHLGAVVEGQVRRLDVSDPDAVTTDDFKGSVKKPSPGEQAPGLAVPKLDWKPFTTKSGKTMFVAPATKEFWAWWRANGQGKNPFGLRPGKYQDQWQVWAEKIPDETAPLRPTTTEPPPGTEPDMGAGGETGQQITAHGTDTGLPPGVNDGGPDFPRELMAASHRLETVVRSKLTLRPGVLGHYVPARAGIARSDKIEVGDIRNQGTVAHEMGHDIDALLFPDVWGKGQPHIHSQASLVERVGTGTKKEYVDELIATSSLMRGPVTVGSPGHVRYRKRATELIADWFALYVHDPDRARAMAPKWTAAFEAKLQDDANAFDTVAGLHARNVRPSAGAGVGPPTGPPAGMPGAVPALPSPDVPRERIAAIAAENLVKGAIRRFEAEAQRARIRSENWRQRVPDQQDRNDVGAFIEGIGNLEIPGDTKLDVVSRMTPAKELLAKDYQYQIELQRQRINQYLLPFEQSEYLAFLEDYLPHFYVNARTPAGQAAIARFIKTSPNARQRKLPSLKEAVDLGLKPVSQDPAVLVEMHARINWRVATNRAFLAQLKRVVTSSGQPVVVPASQNPGGWVVSNNPLIQRVYAHATPSGTMLWKGGAAIHPDVWHAVRQILESPTRSDLARIYDAVNGITRANAFAFSLFHDITLRSASLGAQARWYNPLRGLFRLFEKDPVTGELKTFQGVRGIGKTMLRNEEIVADAALHGLKFAWTDSESYQHAARDVLDKAVLRWKEIPFLGKSLKLARDIQAWRQEGLWRDTHDAFKIMSYHDIVSKALADAPPGTDPRAVKQRVASLLNDAFGGQEWQTKFWLSPQVRLNVARFFLAPDWTLSTLRSVPFLSDAASTVRTEIQRLGTRGPGLPAKEGWRGNIGRARFWTAELAALALGTIAAQFAIYFAFGRKDKGDSPWVWDNESGQKRRIDATPLMRMLPWHKDDPTRYYVNLGKRPEEILHWFVHPEQNIQSKMARPLIEVLRQISGMEGDFPAPWKRDHETFIESLPSRSVSLGREFVPFVFAGNQFALSLPYRKGMTKYKAQQAFEETYELVAMPEGLKRYGTMALRGHAFPTEKILADIRDAAERNGVPVKAVEARAISAVRGEHYSRYFRAYQKGDEKAMAKEADALERLGAGASNIERSIKLRESLQPTLPY